MSNQGPWLRELARVIRPGGYLLATVEGHVKQREMLTPDQMRELEGAGELCLDASYENVSVSTKYTDTWDVFQARPKVLAAFTEHFDVLDYLPGNQDLVVGRAPIGPLEGPSWPPAVPAASMEAARAGWV